VHDKHVKFHKVV